MARYTGPKLKLARREGCDLNLKSARRSLASKVGKGSDTITKPGQHGKTSGARQSDYADQLREKQKVKRMYGILEKQFREYYEKARKMEGATGSVMLTLIERRLDNVVYRMGIGLSRKQARQIVNHGLITVNGKRVNIPSYIVKAGDIIAIKENKQSNEQFKDLKGSKIVMPKWLEFDTNTLTGKILALPKREDIDSDIKEQLIIELYSR